MRIEDILVSQIGDLNLEIKTLTALMVGCPEWFSLRKACEFKGIPYNSIKSNKFKQPRFGCADKMDGTKKYWSRKTVVEWAQVVNEEDHIRYQKQYLVEYKSAI